MLQFIDELVSQVFRVKTLGQLGSGFPHDEGNIVVIRRCLVCVAGRYSCHIETPLSEKLRKSRNINKSLANTVSKTLENPVGCLSFENHKPAGRVNTLLHFHSGNTVRTVRGFHNRETQRHILFAFLTRLEVDNHILGCFKILVFPAVSDVTHKGDFPSFLATPEANRDSWIYPVLG